MINPDQENIFIVDFNNFHWILFTISDTFQSNNIEQFDNQPANTFYKSYWFIYDSLNDLINAFAIKPIMKYMYPDRTTFTIKMVQVNQQKGNKDCG